jgi:ATP-dependent RNA helicase DDX27
MNEFYYIFFFFLKKKPFFFPPKIKQRLIPREIVEEWKEKIIKNRKDVWDILREEKQEKELRLAEMEANKAENLLEHEDEIFSRPKKTWFQTLREKNKLKEDQKKKFDQGEIEGGDESGDEDEEEIVEGGRGKVSRKVADKKNKQQKKFEEKMKISQ